MLGVLAALVSGYALYDRLGVFAFIFAVPVIFSGIMFCSFEYELPEQWNIFIFTLIFTLICSFRIYAVISPPYPENAVFIAETGTVTDVRQWGKIYAAVIDTESRGKFVTFTHFAELTEGERIIFDGSTRNFREARNSGDFDEGRFWRGRGVKGRMTIYNVQVLPSKFSFALMRHKLSRKLSIYMPELTGEYLKAAWLGERDNDLNRRHREWGTSHLLAVSGFHVGIAILCAGIIFGKNAVILSIILWAYVIITGASAGAVRSALMFQAGLSAKIMKRPVEAVNSVCLAGVMILLWRPFLFWDIGWRLSIISVLTITAMFQAGYSWLMISPAVWLVTFPQVSYTFSGVPAVGLILNIFAAIYFSFAFTIASAGAFLRLINFPLSQYFMLAVEGIFLLWEKIAGFMAGLIPYFVGWNYFVAWLGCGTMVFFVCRYLDLAPLRIAAVTAVIGFAAFIMFM